MLESPGTIESSMLEPPDAVEPSWSMQQCGDNWMQWLGGAFCSRSSMLEPPDAVEPSSSSMERSLCERAPTWVIVREPRRTTLSSKLFVLVGVDGSPKVCENDLENVLPFTRCSFVSSSSMPRCIVGSGCFDKVAKSLVFFFAIWCTVARSAAFGDGNGDTKSACLNREDLVFSVFGPEAFCMRGNARMLRALRRLEL